VGFVFTMVTGGNDTTTGLLGGAAELLTNHPSERNKLLNEPNGIRPSVDELVRLTSPVQNLARTTTRPVDVGGATIPSGAKVLLVYGQRTATSVSSVRVQGTSTSNARCLGC